MRKGLLYSLMAMMCWMSGLAQEQTARMNRADQYFKHYRFERALELYKMEYKKQGASDALNRKIGDCYRFSEQYDQAANYYGELVSSNLAEATDYLTYSDILKRQGLYQKATVWVKKYLSKSGRNQEGDMLLADIEYLKGLKAEEDLYHTVDAGVNSEHLDMVPTFYKEDVVFASSVSGGERVSGNYTWNEQPFLDLFQAKKSADGTLKEAKAMGALNTRVHDGPICFNGDGTKAVVTRNSTSSNGKIQKNDEGVSILKLYEVEFKDGKWTDPVDFPFNNDSFSAGHPSLNEDGSLLYFSSTMPGGKGGADLYVCKKQWDGTWSKPENLGDSINTPGDEAFPFIHSSGALFFSSNGHPGLGGFDCFIAYPQDTGFSAVENVAYPLNDAGDDYGLIVNADLQTGYFSSNRPQTVVLEDIFWFKRKYPWRVFVECSGTTFDKETEEPLAGTQLYIKDALGNVKDSVVSDSLGNYSFKVLPDNDYHISASKVDYLDEELDISTVGQTGSMEEKDMYLQPAVILALGHVQRAADLSPLEGVRAIFKASNDPNLEAQTDAEGNFDKRLEPERAYTVLLSKEGYLSKKITVSTEGMVNGVIKLDEQFDLRMLEISGPIELDEIYFDYNKAVITDRAAESLNELVKILNDNPLIEIELSTHTDCRGRSRYNRDLSDRRAKNAAKYIVSQGISRSRIVGKGYGESRLKVECECEDCTEKEHAQNRRAEFVVTNLEEVKRKLREEFGYE